MPVEPPVRGTVRRASASTRSGREERRELPERQTLQDRRHGRRAGRDRVPRTGEGSFEPQIVKKRQGWLTGVDEMVLSLSAKGLTHGGISSHVAEV
ncbi:hypothetical protein GCM10010347_66690 [Streptomyces cirratus]|uniref:Transposase n=1 Tax=Streptomyces cirratus TaxID=68187 RepID=A0ABQ3F5V6_9ACTN|nr:hypothetical protein GCM10010347_66690 [Streptomyces cirratus]